jgi:hypothetical protein
MFDHSKTTAKDFFLYTAAMVALYVSAISLIGLLFGYINVSFPDVLARYRGAETNSIRNFMAALIVAFPLYLYLTRRVNEGVRHEHDKRELWIRKWLIYLTLFVAGTTIAIDLIVLLNSFLGGELSMRFGLKVVTVLVVIGAVFYYYLASLHGRWEKEEKVSKIIAGGVSLVVLVAVISGFFLIGSPHHQRLVRFDETKVNDLENIQWQIVSYWQQHEVLPATLGDISNSLNNFIVPVDPESKESYSYQVTGDRSFELCAVFNLPNTDNQSEYSYPSAPVRFLNNPNWAHDTGEKCFERTIDPEQFPPQKE